MDLSEIRQQIAQEMETLQAQWQQLDAARQQVWERWLHLQGQLELLDRLESEKREEA